jgi:hypothetical protein
MIKIIKQPGKSGNTIVSVLITKKYYNFWKKYVSKNWKIYCDRHDLGLIVIDQFIDNSQTKKKANWHKLLIGKELLKSDISKKIKNVCYLDGDILINAFGAPNIFKEHSKSKISVVNQYEDLPYDYFETQKKISFFRHNYYSKKYPLDSSIFMKPSEVFKFHGFKRLNNYFCSGLFVFNLRLFSKFLENIYFKYTKKFKTLTSGDEPVINYEFQKNTKLKWLNYKYQAIWVYEMANKYPFLYYSKFKNKKIQSECVTSSLMANHFLHFAGSWHESEMIKSTKNYVINNNKKVIKEFYKYNLIRPTASPKGLIKP